MESSGKDHPCSESSVTSSTGPQDRAVPEDSIANRLRDREMLRKRKEAAQQKESDQWILRQNKRQKRGRVSRRGRGQRGEEPIPQPGEKKEPKPEPQEEAEAVLYNPAPLPQPSMLPSSDLFSGIQAAGHQNPELAPRIQNLAGEEKVTPPEPEMPEGLNTPLENVQEDNEYLPHIMF